MVLQVRGHPAHWVKPLKTDGIPSTHVVFDCEAFTETKRGKTAQKWRCGAIVVVRRLHEGEWFASSASISPTQRHLWRAILAQRIPTERLTVWAHNLAFDLQISQGLRHLPELGFDVDAIVLEPTATWAAFTDSGRGLLLCDLHSWLPVPLNALASDMGESRREFKYGVERVSLLERRAREDATLTAYALVDMLRYLECEGVGKFRPTGSGQSHAAWRRKFLPDKTLLVHDNMPALAAERIAMWAGRTESWRHGHIDGPLYEYDLNLAYCRIAAAVDVPVRLRRTLPWVNQRVGCATIDGQVALANVTVKTDLPLVPYGTEDHIYWPVGEFMTWVWQPELDLLRASGADVRINHGYSYEVAPVLAPMAKWLIDELERPATEVSRVAKRLLKHWARTLVGRCALRYRQWEHFATKPRLELGIFYMYEDECLDLREMMHIGRQVMELAEMSEGRDSVPQITGYVMSWARADLWRYMKGAGLDNLAYVDTDSLLLTGRGSEELKKYRPKPHGEILVHKATWSHANISGPRNLTLEASRRIAGVPRRAVRVGEHTFEGEVWEGIQSALAGRRLDGVEVTKRIFDVTALDQRREHLPDGTTRPFEVQNVATD